MVQSIVYLEPNKKWPNFCSDFDCLRSARALTVRTYVTQKQSSLIDVRSWHQASKAPRRGFHTLTTNNDCIAHLFRLDGACDDLRLVG